MKSLNEFKDKLNIVNNKDIKRIISNEINKNEVK